MSVSPAGVRLIHGFEALRLKVYLDTSCLPTVGWGHLIVPSQFADFNVDPRMAQASADFRAANKVKDREAAQNAVNRGKAYIAPCRKITRDEADRLFDGDIRPVERAIVRLVKVELEEKQFDALASFTYNLGIGTLTASMLLRRLNRGEHVAVPAEMGKFIFSAGKINDGLRKRRRLEGAYWAGVVGEEKVAPSAEPEPTPSRSVYIPVSKPEMSTSASGAAPPVPAPSLSPQQASGLLTVLVKAGRWLRGWLSRRKQVDHGKVVRQL